MAYYSKLRPNIYHICRNCTVGNKIEWENLRKGKPPGANLCKTCANKSSQNKCTRGTPTMRATYKALEKELTSRLTIRLG